ncbi:unnamed protein product [Acanthosepion pharaonis]|uniref:Uncharacterized protein n=1 Tax=Acanthosepion pharaonis TaxID=158019 RepID=A0A812C3S7_ACAPH|nr:unnamed protein product [Sepia pharaonis]
MYISLCLSPNTLSASLSFSLVSLSVSHLVLSLSLSISHLACFVSHLDFSQFHWLGLSISLCLPPESLSLSVSHLNISLCLPPVYLSLSHSFCLSQFLTWLALSLSQFLPCISLSLSLCLSPGFLSCSLNYSSILCFSSPSTSSSIFVSVSIRHPLPPHRPVIPQLDLFLSFNANIMKQFFLTSAFLYCFSLLHHFTNINQHSHLFLLDSPVFLLSLPYLCMLLVYATIMDPSKFILSTSSN